MDLFFRKLGEGHPLIILHGLFGSSDNWLTIGKILAENFEVYIIDQRNHGQSPHDEAFDYPTMAQDLGEFIELHKLHDPIIIGHSMGGKVAMEYAVKTDSSWSKLIVVDIAPKSYPVHHDVILQGLNSLELSSLKSRGDADRELSKYVAEVGVRQFLLKNLSRSSSGFEWKINLPVITTNIEIIGAATSWEESTSKPVLFINGSNSNYVKAEDSTMIKEIFTEAKIETIVDAGHWVHAEKMDEFLVSVKSFLGIA